MGKKGNNGDDGAASPAAVAAASRSTSASRNRSPSRQRGRRHNNDGSDSDGDVRTPSSSRPQSVRRRPPAPHSYNGSDAAAAAAGFRNSAPSSTLLVPGISVSAPAAVALPSPPLAPADAGLPFEFLIRRVAELCVSGGDVLDGPVFATRGAAENITQFDVFVPRCTPDDFHLFVSELLPTPTGGGGAGAAVAPFGRQPRPLVVEVKLSLRDGTTRANAEAQIRRLARFRDGGGGDSSGSVGADAGGGDTTTVFVEVQSHPHGGGGESTVASSSLPPAFSLPAAATAAASYSSSPPPPPPARREAYDLRGAYLAVMYDTEPVDAPVPLADATYYVSTRDAVAAVERLTAATAEERRYLRNTVWATLDGAPAAVPLRLPALRVAELKAAARAAFFAPGSGVGAAHLTLLDDPRIGGRRRRRCIMERQRKAGEGGDDAAAAAAELPACDDFDDDATIEKNNKHEPYRLRSPQFWVRFVKATSAAAASSPSLPPVFRVSLGEVGAAGGGVLDVDALRDAVKQKLQLAAPAPFLGVAIRDDGAGGEAVFKQLSPGTLLQANSEDTPYIVTEPPTDEE